MGLSSTSMQGPVGEPCSVLVEPHAGSWLSTMEGSILTPAMSRMRSMQGLGPCRIQVEMHAVSRLRSTQNPGRAQVGLRKIFRMQDLFEEKDQEWGEFRMIHGGNESVCKKRQQYSRQLPALVM